MQEWVTHTSAAGLSWLKRLAATLLFSLIVSFGALFAWDRGWLDTLLSQLTFFRIEEVKIETEWPLAPRTVKAWLPRLEGENLLLIKPATLIAQLEQKPWVDSVMLKKEFPNRIVIDVSTKRARAVRLVRGGAFFVDGQGGIIERSTPNLLKGLDLPIVSREGEEANSKSAGWGTAEAISITEKFQRGLDSQYSVSQIVLGTYPYFRIYLSDPKVEVALSQENWESQLPILRLLLHSPPRQIGQPQRINLVFPKKAVVSSPLSH